MRTARSLKLAALLGVLAATLPCADRLSAEQCGPSIEGTVEIALTPRSLTLISGDGAVGTRDSNNRFTLDGGVTFEDAYIVAPNAAYHVIPGTRYISRSADSSGPDSTHTIFEAYFDLPVCHRNPTFSIQVHADNIATIYLNGIEIGEQSSSGGTANFQDPPESFQTSDPAHFLGGTNVVRFDIYNFLGPTAFDYAATVSFDGPPSTTLYPGQLGALGMNLIEIHGTGPVTLDPGDPDVNGFQKLCRIFGLEGTEAKVYQIDSFNGWLTTFACDQRKAPPFVPCRPVIIDVPPTATSYLGVISPDAACHEGTWTLTHPTDRLALPGDSLFSVPHLPESSVQDAGDLCTQLQLPASTAIIKFLPGPGIVDSHICSQTPQWPLNPGDAVLIRPTATATATLPIQ